jgi:16S rRNA (cytidine1402-2'-O)-methyltransferase
MNDQTGGTLYIVPTPIGNLEDITLRALRILREVGTIACEDTRVTANLLRHFEVPQKRLISYFAGNERERVAQLIAIMRGGDDVALVSDAGTPGISDPGARLVTAAIEAGIRIVPLPGPTAAIPAVVASGLPTDAVLFEGFLPHKKGRQTMLRRLADVPSTFVLYESPHRIVKALNELVEHMGASRRACVAREITKLYEEISRGTLAELAADYGRRASIKGEFVVVVEGRKKGRAEGGGRRDEPEEDVEGLDDRSAGGGDEIEVDERGDDDARAKSTGDRRTGQATPDTGT